MIHATTSEVDPRSPSSRPHGARTPSSTQEHRFAPFLGQRHWIVMAAIALVAATMGSISLSGAAAGDPPISGSLFADFDRDGSIDAGEFVADSSLSFPPGGITVNAFDATGASTTCGVTTGTPPQYSCDVTGLTGSTFRVEFELAAADLTAGWAETFAGPDSTTGTQFVTAGSVANFGFVPPSSCPVGGSSEGVIFTTCQVLGQRTSGGPQDVLVTTDYDLSSGVSVLGEKSDLGAIWGVAYDQWSQTLFTSAYLHRGVDLGDQGLDGLYWQTYPIADPTNSWNQIGLDTLGGPSHGVDPVRDLGGYDSITTDPGPYPVIAKTGIGDIDVSTSGEYIAVSNLEAKTLDLYDITPIRTGGNPTFETSIALSNPGCPDTTNTADWYPWAVTAVDADTFYVGIVCTGETSADSSHLEANIVPVTISSGTQGAAVVSFPLDYQRGCVATGSTCPAGSSDFRSWDSVATNASFQANVRGEQAPIVGDISIGPDGGLAVGIIDRNSLMHLDGTYSPYANTIHQQPSGGDLIRVCNTTGDPNNPVYSVENVGGDCDASANFSSPPITGGTIPRTHHGGPGGDAEWYGADRWNDTNPFHSETAQGGTWTHPLLDETVVAAMDPNNWVSGGLEFFSNVDGSVQDDLQLFAGGRPQDGNGYLGKGSAVGDVEGCWIPLEIGNFVWLDLDGDGVQDPGETPLAGVTVQLVDGGGSVVATVMTDANGQYIFGSSDGLVPNTDYTIRFDPSTNSTPLPGGFTNADLAETLQDSTLSSGSDSSDSDISGGQLSHTTGAPGSVDHTLDAGYILPFDQALTKVLDAPSVDIDTRTATFTIEVTNQGQTIENFSVVDYLDEPTAGVWEDALASANPAGTTLPVDIDYDGTADLGTELAYSFDLTDPQAPAIDFVGTLPSGQSVSVPITLTWADPLPTGSPIENWAEISNFDDGDAATGDALSGDISDADSTPDTTFGDDARPTASGAPGDNEIDGDGSGSDPVTGDEDDHDVAVVEWWDLSLIKTLTAGQPYVLDVSTSPPTASFDISVVNQGTASAHAIGVTDYLPAGTSYTSGVAPAMPTTTADGAAVAVTDNGDGTYEIDTLAPGDSVTFTIILDIDDLTIGNYANGAEIDSFTNLAGATVSDIDSTPDAIDGDPLIVDPSDPNVADDPNTPANSHNELNYDPDGDGNLNEPTPGDEDDHDVEVVVLGFDLALSKVVDASSIPADWATAGTSEITFDITITNQGLAVQSIDVADYVQPGLEFVAASNAPGSATDSGNGESFDFTWTGSDGETTPIAEIRAASGGTFALGESITVPITLRLASDWDGTDPLNWAEISNFDDDLDAGNGDAESGAISDVDSTPDSTQAGDAQPTGPGQPGDDEIGGDGTGSDPITGDEDDHDVAGFPVYDVSLINTLTAGQPYVIDLSGPTPTISFDISVMNQGSAPVFDVGVTDYLPAGTVYTTGTAPAMPTTTLDGAAVTVTDNGDGTYEIDTLAPGDSVTLAIVVDVTDLTLGTYTNGAEIDSIDNNDIVGDAVPTWAVDVDSTPDATDGDPLIVDPSDPDVADDPNTPANSHNELSYDPDGDGNLNEVTPGDEDDHDVEVVVIPYDLALQKVFNTTSTTLPVSIGATVTFDITLTNQGRAVQSIDVTDYIQPGLEFEAALNAAGSITDSGGDSFAFTWVGADGATAPLVELRPVGGTETFGFGETITIPITLRVGTIPNGQSLDNWAEISAFDNDLDGTNTPPVDLDSTPNDTFGDDEAPTTWGEPGDNEIDGDASGTDPIAGDEDDHDVAGVPVLDLALVVELDATASDLPVSPGSEVTFILTVTNQGSTFAEGVTIHDYLDPADWDSFDPALNPDTADYTWNTIGPDAAATLVAPLAPGDTVSIPITLTVADDGDLTDLINIGEISSATATDGAGTEILYPDGSPVADVDSTPDAIDSDPQPSNPDDPTDGVTDNSAGPNGVADEDDHDIAGVEPPSYSLGNQVWLDADNDGTVDADEVPIAGVDVHLFVDADGDGVPDTTVPLATTSTDAAGLYLFSDLPAGDFIVGIPPSQWDPAGPLYGLLSSDPAANDPDDDIDSVDDGEPGANGYVWADPVTLAGAEPVGETPDNSTADRDVHDNLTVDFGFWQPNFDLALRLQLQDGTNSADLNVGDTVTFTATIFNQGNVTAGDINLVDYFPPGLVLADPDWSAGAEGIATVMLEGLTLQPGESVTVDITFTISPGAAGTMVNNAEISAASPTDGGGSVVLLMPNGVPIPDVDSVADAINDDTQTDDVITGTSASGDEDDHDVARINVQTPGVIAFTGSSTLLPVLTGLALVIFGLMFVQGSRRKLTPIRVRSRKNP